MLHFAQQAAYLSIVHENKQKISVKDQKLKKTLKTTFSLAHRP